MGSTSFFINHKQWLAESKSQTRKQKSKSQIEQQHERRKSHSQWLNRKHN
jgi:hypothetical protein